MGYIAKKQTKHGPRYHAVYKKPDGRWKWEAAGRRKQAAEALLKRREMEIASGKYGMVSEVSFRELAEKFLADYVGIRLKPSSQIDYTQVCRNHLIPFFGDRLVSSITASDVQDLVRNKLDGGLSPRTVNKIITILGKAFNQGIKWGLVEKNPVHNVDRPRQEQKEMDFLSPEEIRKLYDACDPDFLPLLLCAVCTGMRQGELLALVWDDIDFERRRIRITKSFSCGHLTGPKSFRSRRTVLMTPVLSMVLAELKAWADGQPDELVFPGEDGGYMSPYVLLSRFEKTLKAAGLRSITWHSLRHTYAALMISLGENIVFISRQLGHSSIRTTIDLYGHLLPEATAGVGERLDGLS